MLSDVRSSIFCDVFSIVLCGLLDIYLRIQLSTVSFCLPTLWTTVNSRRHARLSINLRTCLNWIDSHLWFTGNNHKIGDGSHSSSSQTERKRPKEEWVKSKVRQTHFISQDISSNPLFWLYTFRSWPTRAPVVFSVVTLIHQYHEHCCIPTKRLLQ